MSGAPKTPSLAPGFRFHPTDDELISYYLKRRLSRRPIRVDAIAEVDLYKFEPWDLPAHSRIRSRDLEWYFFSPLDRKYSNRSRTNRATVQGYWKTTGKDRPVKHGARVVGMKKTLVFHVGRAPKGERTNWVMHEYRVEEEGRTAAAGAQQVYDQDGYVVCRIFQKNGVGPQNGAQYGAPFVEEEWEVEEEAADCLVMMADVAEDEGIQVEEEGNRSDNNVDHAEVQANQEDHKHLECGNVSQVNPSVQDIDGKHTVLLDGAIEPARTSKLLDFVNEHGFHNNTNIIEDSKSVIDNVVQSPPNRDDGYLELKDLFNPVDLENSRDMNNALVDGIDEQFLHEVFDVEDLVGGKHPEFSQMSLIQENSHTQSNDLVNSFDGGFPSFEDEYLSFYDAPCDLTFTNEKTDEPGKLNPLVGEPSSDEALDDFLAYFDASDDNMQYDIMGLSDGSEYFNSYIWDHSAVEEVSYPVIKMSSEASASSVIAGGQSSALYRNDFDNFDAAPDFQRNDGGEKPMSNSLVNMLGSISAPPAFASEFPSGSGKAVGHISTTDPGSAVRITAGLIQIHGSTVASDGEHWPLHKRGNISLLLPYHDEVYKSVGFDPITKFQGGALSTMNRGGFCLFIFSAVILTLSCTVGMSIYGR